MLLIGPKGNLRWQRSRFTWIPPSSPSCLSGSRPARRSSSPARAQSVARLVPGARARRQRKPGRLKGKISLDEVFRAAARGGVEGLGAVVAPPARYPCRWSGGSSGEPARLSVPRSAGSSRDSGNVVLVSSASGLGDRDQVSARQTAKHGADDRRYRRSRQGGGLSAAGGHRPTCVAGRWPACARTRIRSTGC